MADFRRADLNSMIVAPISATAATTETAATTRLALIPRPIKRARNESPFGFFDERTPARTPGEGASRVVPPFGTVLGTVLPPCGTVPGTVIPPFGTVTGTDAVAATVGAEGPGGAFFGRNRLRSAAAASSAV